MKVLKWKSQLKVMFTIHCLPTLATDKYIHIKDKRGSYEIHIKSVFMSRSNLSVHVATTKRDKEI